MAGPGSGSSAASGQRSLQVPRGLTAGSVAASLTDGVLEIRLPEPEALKPHRVEIAAGHAASGQPRVSRAARRSPGPHRGAGTAARHTHQARRRVRQSMQQLVAELTRPVVLSDRALRHLARLKDAYRRLIQASGTEPSVAELARATGLSREQVENLLVVDRPAVSPRRPSRRGR